MRILLSIITLFASSFSYAQTPEYDALGLATNDQARIIARSELATHMRAQLDSCTTKEELVMMMTDWPFGAASAGSNKDWAIVLSWNSENSSREQSYGGFVIFNDDKSDAGWSWVELEHSVKEDINDDGRSYRTNSWTGALYYSMVLKYDGKTPVYTLLGWDGADGIVTRKVIETMSINNGMVRVGVPYIEKNEGLKKRFILEYGDILQVTLKYDEETDQIIFDRLAPNDPSLIGQTAFYGPTLDYNAFVWQEDKWVLETFVEVKNEGSRKDRKPYNDPRPKNSRGR